MKSRVSSLLAWALPAFFASCALDFPRQDVEVHRVEVAADAPAATEPEPATVPVFLFADELHTGLILDLGWLRRHGYAPPAGTQDRRWAAFSWGDEVAYVQQEWLSPGQVVNALFMPSPSVMEIIVFDYNVPNVCHHQRLFQAYVPEAAGASLAAFLNDCAVRDAGGLPQTLGPASWGEGLLIRSPHSYYFPRICNVWTVEALNAAGFRFHALTGLSADGVLRQARLRRNGFQKIWDPTWQMGEGGPTIDPGP